MSNKSYKDEVKKMIPYSDQDFDSLMQSVIESIPTLTPEYNDASSTDMGMTILEEAVKLADVLSWKADVVMNEALPGNARSRKAALIQSKWLNYKPRQNTSSLTNMRVTVTNDGNPIVIPKGIRFATGNSDDDVIFESYETLTFSPPVGTLIDETYEVIVPVRSGIVVEELLGYSSGKPNQTFTTTKTPYIHESMTLEILNEVTNSITLFTESDYMFDIKNNENKFVLRFDEKGYGTVQFGDGVNGNIPYENSMVLARYRIGGGGASNVSVGSVNTLINTFDNRIVSVTNVSDAYGGEDEETIASINANAGNVFKTRNRLVTADDCEIWARSNAYVDDAFLEKDNAYVDLYWLYLLPTNRNWESLPTDVKTQMKAEVDKICMLGDDIRLADPIYKNIEISVRISCDVLYDSVSVYTGVFKELSELILSKMLGESLSVSDVYKTITSVDGVAKINLTKLCEKGSATPIGDVDCLGKQVVRLEYDEDIVITSL